MAGVTAGEWTRAAVEILHDLDEPPATYYDDAWVSAKGWDLSRTVVDS